MGIFHNSENQDKIPQNVTFHQKFGISAGCALFARTKLILREKYKSFGIITCDHLICTMDIPDLTVNTLWNKSKYGSKDQK